MRHLSLRVGVPSTEECGRRQRSTAAVVRAVELPLLGALIQGLRVKVM